MKKISLFIALLILSSNLSARENPFEPTQTYNEEVARLMEIDESYPDEFDNQEKYYIKEIQDNMKANSINKDTKASNEKKEPEVLTEEKVKKLITQAQQKTVSETKKIVKELKEQKSEEIIYVKPRTDVSYEKEILPFLKLEYTNEKLQLQSKYKVFKKFTLPNKNKMILDFYANENFYTIREDLNSTNFTKITVGNHKKDKFFRVVVELSDTPLNYEVTYDDNQVTIYKLEQM
ncbi:AMIN domain-containing protein [Malaciobacter mytili]|uniref:AMIN domain-containing protein n=1 Tax=Malaciobacter mytili TaxID=603050 RepID=UPI003A869DEA